MGRRRAFDHELAQVMRHEGGLSFVEIADEFGVSIQSVRMAVLEDERRREADRRRDSRWWVGTCRDCGGPATRVYPSSPQRQGRCLECAIQASVKSARPTTLRCSLCRLWLPDDAFPRGRVAARRHRAAECTLCNSARRRIARAQGGT